MLLTNCMKESGIKKKMEFQDPIQKRSQGMFLNLNFQHLMALMLEFGTRNATNTLVRAKLPKNKS